MDIPSTPFDGNMAVWLVPAIAVPSAPTVTEINAGVDISCYLTPDGYAPTIDQATITDDRLCSTETFGQPGRKTRSLTLTGIDNTNSLSAGAFNELVDTLVEGTEMFVVRRRGIAFDTPVASTQKVSVLQGKPGVKQDVAPEANSVTRSTWVFFITGSGHDDVTVGPPPAAWAATTQYTVGQTVTLAGGEVLQCTDAGTSGASEPAAPAAVGGTVTDGTVTWQRVS